MKIIKIILSLAVFAVLAVLLLFGWTALKLNVIGPWQHELNTKEAELFNQTIWETGSADIYTISTIIKIRWVSQPVSMDIICVPKMVTATSTFKNITPYRGTATRSFSPANLNNSLTEDYREDNSISCRELARSHVEQRPPYNSGGYQSVEITSVRQTPVRDVLTREEYGPADRAVIRAQERERDAP